MRPVLVSLLCIPALLQAARADAATLRDATTLESSVVRVADLFDDAGSGASRVLGPAPAPGNRIVIEAAQLAAIARQFGIDWRPGSPGDRVVLDRPGRPLPREVVFDALRQALSLLGAASDLELDLPGFTSPTVPQEGEPKASIDQLDYDSTTGRFTALLEVTAQGMDAARERLSGRVSEMLELPVLVRRIPPGAIIQADDTRMTRVRADLARGDVARVAAQMTGLSLRRAIAPGQPIAISDLVRPSAILKGARVIIELQAPGLSLSAQGVAMDNGAIGERIPVLNPTTRAILSAEILGPSRVRVTPGVDAAALPRRSDLVAAR